MRSATETALATPELLEVMMLGVDMRTVLISAQRVCRYWRELISKSGPLQEHLYFKPRRTTSWDDLEENQLACAALPVRLLRLRGYDFSSSSRSQDTLSDYIRLVREEQSIWVSCEKVTRREASWRKMLVCQPVTRPQTKQSEGNNQEMFVQKWFPGSSFILLQEELLLARIISTTWHGIPECEVLHGVRLLISGPGPDLRIWGDSQGFHGQYQVCKVICFHKDKGYNH